MGWPGGFTPREAERLRLLLKLVHFLEHIDEPALDALIGAMERRPFKAREVLVREGDRGDSFFIIATGSARVLKKARKRNRHIATLGPFTYFGELALLNDIPRTATVVGAEKGESYVLTREAFDRILLSSPEIAASIRETAAVRLSRQKE